jgi:hypothetical protein
MTGEHNQIVSMKGGQKKDLTMSLDTAHSGRLSLEPMLEVANLEDVLCCRHLKFAPVLRNIR